MKNLGYIILAAFLAISNIACESDATLDETRVADITAPTVSLKTVTVDKFNAIFEVSLDATGDPATREYGVLISTESQLDMTNSTILAADITQNIASISATLAPGTTYYTCAYALTANQFITSEVKTFTTEEHYLGAFLGKHTLSGYNLSIEGSPVVPIEIEIVADDTNEKVAYLKIESKVYLESNYTILFILFILCSILLSEKNKIDITMPGRRPKAASVNLLTSVEEEIVSILTEIGFRVVEGNEIEDDFHNFEALNIPYYHPSRDSHDSFFISKEHVLRTHTSGMQIRTMLETPPPIAVVSPGKCARRDAIDSKHSPVFHQVEGLMVDSGISFNDLKGVLELFCKKMFGDKTQIRLRPDYFPFVEPGADLSATCVICGGSGCKTCGGEGWLELMGAGMIHPNVFKHVGYDINKYTGFAFGMGIERVAMIKYGITDIRMFYENDIDFLKQW